MAKFYLLTQQPGEGCDYTIGCGMRWELILAQSEPEAEEEATKRILERGWKIPEHMMNVAVLVPGDKALDLGPALDGILANKAFAAEAENAKRREEDDRAKYEELRRRFGDD